MGVLTVEEDSPAYRERLTRIEENLDEFRNRSKKLADRCKAMGKAYSAFTKEFRKFVEDLEQLTEIEQQFDGESKFAKFMAKLSPTFSVLISQQEAWVQSAETEVGEPIELLLKNDFKDFEESRKAYTKARSVLEAADASFKKLAGKRAVNHQAIAQAEYDYTSRHHNFELATVDHVHVINCLHVKKEMVVLDRVRNYAVVTVTNFGNMLHLVNQQSELLKSIQTSNEARQRSLDGADTAEYVARRKVIEQKRSDLRPAEGSGVRGTVIEDDFVKESVGPLAKEKRGYVQKQSSNLRKDWKRRFAVLKDGHFKLYHSPKDTEATVDLNVMLANVKPYVDKGGKENCFQVISTDRAYVMQADDEQELKEWMTTIQNATAAQLNLATSDTATKNPLDQEVIKSSQLEAMVTDLWAAPGNEKCCDCYAANPEWASINLGILICIECSGHHRSLGTHISKVRSFKLDDWDPEVFKLFTTIGNSNFNSVYEKKDGARIRFKPTEESLALMREQYIKKKYIDKVMIGTDKPEDLTDALHEAAENNQVLIILSLLAHGAEIDAVDEDQLTPLHTAANAGSTSACLVLILNGANIDALDKGKRTPLHYAALEGHIGACKVLLRNDANPKLVDGTGATALDLADGAENDTCSSIISMVVNPPTATASTSAAAAPLDSSTPTSPATVPLEPKEIPPTAVPLTLPARTTTAPTPTGSPSTAPPPRPQPPAGSRPIGSAPSTPEVPPKGAADDDEAAAPSVKRAATVSSKSSPGARNVTPMNNPALMAQMNAAVAKKQPASLGRTAVRPTEEELAKTDPADKPRPDMRSQSVSVKKSPTPQASQIAAAAAAVNLKKKPAAAPPTPGEKPPAAAVPPAGFEVKLKPVAKPAAASPAAAATPPADKPPAPSPAATAPPDAAPPPRPISKAPSKGTLNIPRPPLPGGTTAPIMLAAPSVALYDCDGDDETELTFKKGAALVVTTVHCPAQGDGWWMGTGPDGKQGLFPRTYVRVDTSGFPKVKAGEAYPGTGDGEMALEANEDLFVLQAMGTTATVLKAGADPMAGKVPISALKAP